MYRILIIDDSPADSEELSRKLACFGLDIVTAMSLKGAKSMLEKSAYRDIVICDYKLPDGTSVELLEWLAKNRIYRDVIVVSDMADNPLAIESFRAGTKDYIQKRQTDQLLIPRLKRLIGGGFDSEYKSVVLPRCSPQFNEIQRIISLIAPTRLNVLITGEGGCGKEPLAQEIYRKSDRSDRPCIIIDSAMLPMLCPANNKRTAYQMVEDYFAKAEHSTVIIDHIHLLSFDMQTMILNILDRQRPDIRLIATTHATDIAERVNKGEFRQGLYYTLRQTHIDIPPLRECKEDIIPLAEFFLQRYSYEFSRRIKGFDTKAKKKLSMHTWPGNIRELKHVVRFAVIEATGDLITSEDRLGICSCGIFRTFGWVNVALTIDGDSLMIKAKDYGSPLVGRFRIESAERLTGILTMGYPGEDWYFSGPTEFIKQKPIMPDNLSPDLEGIILPYDYGKLALDRDKAWDALSTVSPNSYGYREKGAIEKLLNAKTYPITPKDLIGFRRVRSIQIDARDGIFSYPYFNCRFKTVDGKVFFEKTTGSQRKSGYVYPNNPKSLIFLGGWSVNDDPQTEYGSPNSVVGTIYKIGLHKAIMIFPSDDDRVEIYELTN